MANFASSVRFQVKTGQEDAFLEAVMKFDASQHPGCISHQVIDAGNGRFQSNVVWENEDAIAAARPNLIKFLDTMRPTPRNFAGVRRYRPHLRYDRQKIRV